jgi:hypothetical protein
VARLPAAERLPSVSQIEAKEDSEITPREWRKLWEAYAREDEFQRLKDIDACLAHAVDLRRERRFAVKLIAYLPLLSGRY